MKEFLAGKVGKKCGFLRIGYPKEVFFEGVLKAIQGDVLIIEDAKMQEIALTIDKIIMIGPPEKELEQKPVGFAKAEG